MKQSRIYLIITAILLLCVGVVCVLNPGESFVASAWIVGLLIVLSGASTLLFGVRSRGILPNSSMTTFLGIFELVVGTLFLINGMFAAATLVVVFALWVLFEGISLAVLSFDYKRYGFASWWIMTLLGVASIVLGVLALRYPVDTGIVLGILLGLGIFANGLVRIVAFFAIKRISNKIQDIKDSATAYNIDDLQNK